MMIGVVMLSAFMLNAIVLSFIMLSFIVLNVILVIIVKSRTMLYISILNTVLLSVLCRVPLSEGNCT
jgi:hypothetical protein